MDVVGGPSLIVHIDKILNMNFENFINEKQPMVGFHYNNLVILNGWNIIQIGIF